MKTYKSLPLPKLGTLIEITNRNCTPKQQPHFSVGSKFVVKDATTHGDGSLQVVVVHPKRKKATLTFNTKNIEFREVSIKDIQEGAFRKSIKEEVNERLEKLTKKEHYQITFVPLVITEIAFIYAEKVHKYCAEHRVSEVKKLGRAVRTVREDYINYLRQDLKDRDISRIESETREFLEEYSYDFFIMYAQASNIISNKYDYMEHKDMRTLALIGREMCNFFNEYNHKMNKLIEKKLGSVSDIHYPYQSKLMTCLDAYLGDADKIKRSDYSQFDMCFGVIQNKLMNCDFIVTD